MKKIGSIFIALLSLSSFAFGIEDLNFNQVILGPNQKSYYDKNIICGDEEGNRFILGRFKGTSFINNDTITTSPIITSNMVEYAVGLFLAKYDSNGALIFYKRIAEGDSIRNITMTFNHINQGYITINF